MHIEANIAKKSWHFDAIIAKKLKYFCENSEKQAKINFICFASFRYCEKDAKQSENMRKHLLFVSQKEAKSMRNGLRFANISHVSEKN
jgi:hypothetical protein